jgi:hypothetical protein
MNWHCRQHGFRKESDCSDWVISPPVLFFLSLLIHERSAGVIGLQTSISLLEAGYRVFVVAKHLPGDKSIEYTSPWYAGQYLQ